MPGPDSSRRSELLRELAEARARVAQLEQQLAALAAPDALSEQSTSTTTPADNETSGGNAAKRTRKQWPLSLREYKRYGRQMLVSQVGLPGPSPLTARPRSRAC
jgi:adenylyltransferase/sulfurtransferase